VRPLWEGGWTVEEARPRRRTLKILSGQPIPLPQERFLEHLPMMSDAEFIEHVQKAAVWFYWHLTPTLNFLPWRSLGC
jgi:hypothetical protein